MPAPGSEIPAAQPIDLAAAIRRAGVPVDRPPVRGRGTRAVPGYEPSVPETEFKRLFPLPYRVESVSMYEAKRHHWKTDRSYWQFLEKFQYVSPACHRSCTHSSTMMRLSSCFLQRRTISSLLSEKTRSARAVGLETRN